MALLFTCFVAFLILQKVPIVGDILLVALFCLFVWFCVATYTRYSEIQVEREAASQFERR